MIWRGEIYDVHLGLPIGHESAFTRPAIVVSADLLNNGPGGLVTVVPLGSMGSGLRSHVEVGVRNSGLDRVSYARCDQLRTISTERLRRRRGAAAGDEISLVDQAIRFVLDL